MQKILSKIYVLIFILVTFVPFLFAHREENRIAENENRYYANVPKVIEEGQINKNYTKDFDNWINDNARFRSLFREIKVTVLYYLFGYLDMENVGVGTNGDFFSTASNDIETVQGRNLMNTEKLEEYEGKLYSLQQWLGNKSVDFYYMQCYDKMTMMDNYYPIGVVQYDTRHIGEHTEEYIHQKNRVNIVLQYDYLKAELEKKELYYKYHDCSHWNDEGTYIGYKELMKKIQQNYPEIDYLELEDYEIGYRTAIKDIYGFDYPYEETIRSYRIKDINAQEMKCDMFEKLNVKEHTHYFNNTKGKKRILVINDSFIRIKMKNFLAESFEECLSIDLTNLSNIEWIVEEYQPDIVLLECVETNIPRVEKMLETLECIKE